MKMSGDLLKIILLNEGGLRSSRLTKADEEICNLKDSLLRIVTEEKLNLKPLISENAKLTSKIQGISDGLSVVSESLKSDVQNEITTCTTEVKNLSSTLLNVKSSLHIIDRVIAINSSLTYAKQKFSSQQFYECALCLNDVNNEIKKSGDLENLELFIYLKEDFILLREKILFDMSELWSSLITVDSENNQDIENVIIKIDQSNPKAVSEIIRAVFHMNEHFIERRFFNKLRDKLLLPLIVGNSEISQIQEDNVYVLSANLISDRNQPHYSIVLLRILTVIEFVKKYLDVPLNNNNTFVSEMGKYMAEGITSSLMKNCLSAAASGDPEQIDPLDDIVVCAEKFQSSLQSMGFLPLNALSYVDQTYDLNLLFANKMYISYLGKARELMKKDLHSIATSQDLSLSDEYILPKAITKAIHSQFNLRIDEKQFFFSCQVSKSAEEVRTLIQAIEKELKKSEESRAIRLLYTIRNILEMYGAVVPVEHGKILETIPQQTAIFHNNCLYLAHFSITLANDCYGLWPSFLKEEYHVFLDQGVSLRQRAIQSLENCISNQRSQIIYILRDSGLGALYESQTLDSSTEKAVRQCLRQMQILCNVWMNILPNNIFSNAMAFLADAFLDEVITLVLAAEDISSRTANELVTIFNIIQNRLPSSFIDPKEVHRLCKTWGKFNEITSVLAGSLNEISDRWSDGAGPLACEFTAEQVKRMIRALFQNTERRSTLLSRIK